ncbi:uncharacterized protein PGTG_19053 [Puccinia graminis f. sp. tritici CRL 75-36-700-3]|uniref:Uncharacterized protein n=1 Tax=Puccinia graminis f. sp. tritici (strain CRL 75-36-700-3 / race SCCL) TaxID=418459 RepID=E3L8P9_PUCGT|nr:uncharacterized protein PGTG_19053 [Puccinia graminis f. sp. tritici CRL 75-36-700-3]EFP92935.2 hypothetical protein PGTG_19053 [Puccinia graminis f. sp. tritici CRL 75-36-700-3]
MSATCHSPEFKLQLNLDDGRHGILSSNSNHTTACRTQFCCLLNKSNLTFPVLITPRIRTYDEGSFSAPSPQPTATGQYCWSSTAVIIKEADLKYNGENFEDFLHRFKLAAEIYGAGGFDKALQHDGTGKDGYNKPPLLADVIEVAKDEIRARSINVFAASGFAEANHMMQRSLDQKKGDARKREKMNTHKGMIDPLGGSMNLNPVGTVTEKDIPRRTENPAVFSTPLQLPPSTNKHEYISSLHKIDWDPPRLGSGNFEKVKLKANTATTQAEALRGQCKTPVKKDNLEMDVDQLDELEELVQDIPAT